MIQGKKGLSDVVTTVLIVLLVLAAVAAVWAFINNLIQQGGSAVDAQSQCVGLRVESVSCSLSGTTANIAVQWKAGSLSNGVSLSGLTTNIIGINNTKAIVSSTYGID